MIAKIRISGTNWAMALPSMGGLLFGVKGGIRPGLKSRGTYVQADPDARSLKGIAGRSAHSRHAPLASAPGGWQDCPGFGRQCTSPARPVVPSV
ncbi:hypothetical protein GCM10011415_26050 [Salipiger pallidus]|uniref:Uncharacterized protein n=1 Tax=Salipiger pallidus TaxID=1775170 RepID=A0A8J2ZKM9_9RHOB|nr:hypothetical protein GCM10011415_26050 [Salipiger pallidus]